MANEKEKKNEAARQDDLEAASGPREKGSTDDLQILVAQLRQRTVGLTAEELETEINRFFEKLIDRHAKVVPEALRAEHRKLLRDMLEADPTLQAMTADLRRGLGNR
jgi:hypothetical protein